jgi:hypothetical protein
VGVDIRAGVEYGGGEMKRYIRHPIQHLRWMWQQWRMKRKRKKWRQFNVAGSQLTKDDLDQLSAMVQKTRFKVPTTIGRNCVCPCGSGKKFKHCCLRKIKGA